MKRSNLRKQDDLSGRFASEANLQQVLAGLLTRMDGISGVQVLHGTQEYGKDIVFNIQGGFGENILCACVVKNTPITGSVSGSSSARTVYLQVEQSFDTPHVDAGGRPVMVERVYVVTPFSLSPATLQSISGKLARLPGQVQFIGGTQLFDLFKRHWPSVVADEFSALQAYLAKVEEAMAGDDNLTSVAINYQLAPPEKIGKPVYIAPLLSQSLTSFKGPLLIDSDVIPTVELRRQTKPGHIDSLGRRLQAFHNTITLLSEGGYVDQNASVELENDLTSFSARLRARWDIVMPMKLANLTKELEGGLRKLELSKSLRRLSIEAAGKQEPYTAKEVETEARALIERDGVDIESHELVSDASLLSNRISALLMPFRQVLAESHALVGQLRDNDSSQVFLPAFMKAVALSRFAHDSPTGTFELAGQALFRCSSEVIDHGHHLMILAPAGYGKTRFCRWHALRDLERFRTGSGGVVPVYIALHELAARLPVSFRESARSIVGKSALLGDMTQGPSCQTHRLDFILMGSTRFQTIVGVEKF